MITKEDALNLKLPGQNSTLSQYTVLTGGRDFIDPGSLRHPAQEGADTAVKAVEKGGRLGKHEDAFPCNTTDAALTASAASLSLQTGC